MIHGLMSPGRSHYHALLCLYNQVPTFTVTLLLVLLVRLYRSDPSVHLPIKN
jgi:hypothetical protein